MFVWERLQFHKSLTTVLTKFQKISIQWIALSGFHTSSPCRVNSISNFPAVKTKLFFAFLAPKKRCPLPPIPSEPGEWNFISFYCIVAG